MLIPEIMKAIVVQPEHVAAVVEHPVPTIEDNELLIKVEYAAYNPIDSIYINFLSPIGAVIGCDYSGTIVAVGSEAASEGFKVGQKVASMVHGGKFPDRGAFAEYVKAQSDLVYTVGENQSMTDAATYGVCFVTAAQILYGKLEVPFPPARVSESEWILIYGGSSSVGMYAVQLAKLAGLKVVTTASPKNFELLRSLGADEVFDHHDADKAIEGIKRVTENKLFKALDTISISSTLTVCLKSFSDDKSQKRKLNITVSIEEDPQALANELGIEVEWTVAFTMLGTAFEFFPGVIILASTEDRTLYRALCAITPELIEKKLVKPNPVKLFKGLFGFDRVLEYAKSGQVSAEKIVMEL